MPYSEETYLLCMCVSLCVCVFENLATVQQKLLVTFWGHQMYKTLCARLCIELDSLRLRRVIFNIKLIMC